jgi:hypothetical protein
MKKWNCLSDWNIFAVPLDGLLIQITDTKNQGRIQALVTRAMA